MRTIRHTQEELARIALAQANEQQRPVIEHMLKTGFKVLQTVHVGGRIAVNLAWQDTSGWLTPDAKFHRPVKGKKRVAINTRTLERIW
ncbi:hypothetical protein [Sinorhizobium fredii]|uniref:hypothetical protein n=1 Tax=Rhizobium fredii TaxID=380 RepID=UPI0012981EED|nr:hypothetical protein [Sinorhizobium fredii]MQW94088.1 hypothetical protein [Sinorhizobium fredii]